MTAVGGGQAVPSSTNALRGGSRAPRAVTNRAGNGVNPGGGPIRASGTQRASETAGITKAGRSTRSTRGRGSGAA